MTTKADQISVVLSGGTSNIDPNQSLGGDPSNTSIVSGNLNNLFDDVSAEEGRDGVEDYRCIYFFNDGDTTIYSLKLFISSDSTETLLGLGIESRNEIQRITIGSGVTGGSFTLSYKNVEFVSNYHTDL